MNHLDQENSGRYSHFAAAKSAVGICTPEFTKRTTALIAVFLCAVHGYTSQWWGVQGSRKAGRILFVTGSANPVRLTTLEICTSGGDILNHHEEAAIMATIPTLAQPEITVNNGQTVTSSLAVADYFTKRHSDVIRKIESLECSAEFRQRNSASAEYIDEQGKRRPAYQITRDGFTFLATGFTGKRAAAFKEAYIYAFNEMELKQRPQQKVPQLTDALSHSKRVRDNLSIALNVWVNILIPENPPIMLSGTLLDSLHRTALVVQDLEQVLEGGVNE